jgi:peptide/nickel transport system substrate-binding protein
MTSPAAAAKIAAPQPKTGGTLRMGLPGDLATLDGHLTQGLTGFDTLWQVFDRLTAYDSKLQPQPMLAESWDLSADLTQIKLNLRKGVQFHSGRDFTERRCEWNLLRVRDPKSRRLRQQSNWFSTIDTPDKNTLIHEVRSTPARGVRLLRVSQHPRPGLDGISRCAPASGGYRPIRFRRMGPELVQFTRNRTTGDRAAIPRGHDREHHHRSAGASGAARIRWARYCAQSIGGQSNATPSRHVPSGAGPPSSAQFFVLGANVLMPPMDNKLVRQAVSLAIDRKRFADTVLAGLDAPEALPWLTFSPAYEAAKQGGTFDLDKARSLLNQSGVGSFAIDALISSASDELFELAQILQADLAKIGVTVTVQRLRSAALLDQINNRRYRGITIAARISRSSNP